MSPQEAEYLRQLEANDAKREEYKEQVAQQRKEYYQQYFDRMRVYAIQTHIQKLVLANLITVIPQNGAQSCSNLMLIQFGLFTHFSTYFFSIFIIFTMPLILVMEKK